MTPSLRNQFIGTLEEMEKLLRTNAAQLGMETLTNAAYYYCKFQAGSPDFWTAMEG
jgi:hypothetical protein